jgi:putative DNA primase/helicase
MSAALALVLSKLPDSIRSGSSYTCRCPAHEDNYPSLSIREGRDGRVLLRCHAGCKLGAIVASIGLEVKDLFVDRPGREDANGGTPPKIVATYQYTDAQGEVLYEVVRYEPKSFKQRKPDGAGGWLWNLKGVKRVPYRLDRIVEAAGLGRIILIPEGEADVATAERLGYAATCNAGGAGKWPHEFGQYLANARVVVIPDSDVPGERHAQHVAASCEAAGCRVCILRMPHPHKDLSDWAAAGGTPAKLEELIGEATEWSSAQAGRDPATANNPLAATAVYTDLNWAERFAAAEGGRILFVPEEGEWLIWDGARYAGDVDGEVQRRIKGLVKREFESAWRGAALDKTLIRRLLRAQSCSALKAIQDVTRSERDVIGRVHTLDQHPMLLTVANGTVDLSTGELNRHDSFNRITKLTPIPYDPGATAPRFLEFLDRVCGGDADLVQYLVRVMGYGLTGRTDEQALFFLYGFGKNGKSTLLNILATLAGEYARTADFAQFLVARDHGRDGATEGLARLRGARVVTAIETSEGRRWDEGRIKLLTGGDKVAARFLYGHQFEFLPEFKLFLASNHKPTVRGTDDAIWRRLHLIPFAIQIPEQDRDPRLKDKLLTELPGILALAVRGCLDWQLVGLRPPRPVTAATEEYRRESDVFGDFLAERCETAPAYVVAHSELYGDYQKWAAAGNLPAMSTKAFGQELEERGFPRKVMGHLKTVHRLGIRLRTSRPTGYAYRDAYAP